MTKDKIYPYMKRKKQINLNISKVILDAIDKERIIIDDFFSDKVDTRSEFIQTAIVHYLGFLYQVRINNRKEADLQEKK